MSEWISVQERLPEPNVPIVFIRNCAHDRVIESGHFFDRRFESDRGSIYAAGISHWMPLPPLPTPKLTVKEALREAVDLIDKMIAEHPEAKWSKRPAECNIVSRLRAALEGEE